MSYIQCFNENNYKPSENLKNLFEELVIQPFNNHPPTQAWVTEVKNKDNEYHRKTILKRGRADFDMPFNGLSPDDKVLLYCVYYMPMHLYSSYHIFSSKLSLPVSNKVIFIDFGCGPLTSGIAYWAATRHNNITYIGIDIAPAMLDKAREINDFGPSNRSIPFFENVRLIRESNRLPDLLDHYISEVNTQIIINFSYILASHSINVHALSDVLNQIVEKYKTHKMTVVYQNPRNSSLHRKWFVLKAKLSMFRSQVTESNIVLFGYERLIIDGCHRRDVYYDILSKE